MSTPGVSPLFILLLIKFTGTSFYGLFNNSVVSVNVIFSTAVAKLFLGRRVRGGGVGRCVVFVISTFITSLYTSATLVFSAASRVTLTADILCLIPNIPLVGNIVSVMRKCVLAKFTQLARTTLLVIDVTVNLSFALLVIGGDLV